MIMHAAPVTSEETTGKKQNAITNEANESLFFRPALQQGGNFFFSPINIPVQQKTAAPVVQRAPAQPADIKVQEQSLKKEFADLKTSVDATNPNDKAGKEKIKTLVVAFLKDFAAYHPSPTFSPWDTGSDEHDTEPDKWKHINVYSLEEANDLAARLMLIGLSDESTQFLKLPSVTVHMGPREQDDEFNKSFAKAALERVNLSSIAGETASIDLLVDAFNFVVKEIIQLDPQAIEKDKGYASFYGSDEIAVSKSGAMGEWPYFVSLTYHLGEIYGGMQLVIQNKMEKVYKELDSSGEAPSMSDVLQTLDKISKAIPADSKFLKEFDGKPYFLHAANAKAAITRTEFNDKGGVHKDFFDRSDKAPSVKIEYYDKEQKEGNEKYLPIEQLHLIRGKQLAFIQSFYGLDKQGKKIAGKQGPKDLMPSQNFSLFSIDDWRIFLDKKFDDLVTNQHLKTADAFLTIISLLQSYLQAFTIHTPFNIEDFGPNYLTETFPRALSGQLIHDCGVYALKIVYMLSLLASRLKLKMQFILLPNHVGLIIRGEQTPVLLVHNDTFRPIPLTEAQFDDLSTENKRLVLNEGGLKAYEKAKAQNDTSALEFTFDKMKAGWTRETKDKGIKGPVTDEQFLAEQSANLFVSQTDMPFIIKDIDAKDYGPKLKTDKIKKNLWDDYESLMRGNTLFNEKALAKPYSSTYQFNLHYLNLTVQTKNFNNDILLPYWNVKAMKEFQDLRKKMDADIQAKDKTALLTDLKAYRDNFSSEATDIVTKFKPIADEKKFIHDTIADKDPDPLKAGISRTFGERDRPDEWQIAFLSHMQQLNQRIQNLESGSEGLSGGTDITPAFATPADNLEYFP